MLPKTITILGASSVFGKVDPKGGFVGRFKLWYESKDLEFHTVYNLGIPGDNTTGMVQRVSQEIQARKPDLVIFSLGSNDAARNGKINGPVTVDLKTFKKNVNKLIEIGRKNSDKVIFISAYPIVDSKTHPFRDTNKYYSMKDLTLYIEETKKICQRKKVPYLDIFSMFLNRNYRDYIFKDGLHCNLKGHQLIFQQLVKFLQDLYK